MLRWGAAAYAIVGILALLAADFVRDGSAFLHPEPWLTLEPSARHVYSILWGLSFGGLVVVCTRTAVARFAWARGLHAALRPFARTMGPGAILSMALLSAFGEETVFRGLLEPWIGIVPQAVVFGAVHQIPGPSRWVWIAWATVVGLALGCIFRLTGSLLGPLTAHALINALNLSFLKAYDPSPRRALGGLLGGSTEPKPKPSH